MRKLNQFNKHIADGRSQLRELAIAQAVFVEECDVVV